MIMPGITGVELLNKLKESDPGHFPKCIVLSNQSEGKDIDDAMSAGALGYIVKAEMIPSDVVKEVKKMIN